MFCQSNDFFYSCHRISKLSYLFNIGLWSQQSVTNIISVTNMNLVTPKAGAKHDFLFNQPTVFWTSRSDISNTTKCDSTIDIREYISMDSTDVCSYRHLWRLHYGNEYLLLSLVWTAKYPQNQGILKEEVSLYHWPPVWLVWILFCK